MKILIKFLIIQVLFISCISSSKKDEEVEYCSIEMKNRDLIEAITEYQEFLFKDNVKYIERGDSVYVGICSKDINDSVYRHVLFPVYNIVGARYSEPFELCKLNGHHVIISYTNTYRPYPMEFCNHTETVRQRYAQLLFPKEYEESKKQMSTIFRIYEPENCYLTFIGDSLIDKTYKCGGPRDKILVNLNGKDVYL